MKDRKYHIFKESNTSNGRDSVLSEYEDEEVRKTAALYPISASEMEEFIYEKTETHDGNVRINRLNP